MTPPWPWSYVWQSLSITLCAESPETAHLKFPRSTVRFRKSLKIARVTFRNRAHHRISIAAKYQPFSAVFDSVPVRTVNGQAQPLEISGETGPAASIDALMSIAPYCRLDGTRAQLILAKVERAVSRWRESGRKIGMSDLELDSFAEAFESNGRVAVRKTTKAARCYKIVSGAVLHLFGESQWETQPRRHRNESSTCVIGPAISISFFA